MDNLLVNSSPSKEFFLNMITKDVTVESCILDLIDNSIDAYKRKKEKKEQGNIEISYSIVDDYFSINDNCGGMSKEIAVNKAFRFGNERNRDAGTLGMYGIGMKRSIFKIGSDFIVESKTDTDAYKVYMNREEWTKLKDEKTNDDIWKFHLDDVELNFDNCVNIKIKKLSDSLKTYLKMRNNIETLREKISSAYGELLENGITISINGEKIHHSSEYLYKARFLESYVNSYHIGKNREIAIRIIAGVGDPSPKDAGWDIICNGRAVIQKDRTELTGWESTYDSEEETGVDEAFQSKTIPAFHNDFARFRGYVYIDCDDPNQLPLNTTKDSIDQQHFVYQFIFQEMRKAMQRILPELRRLQQTNRECIRDSKIPPSEEFQKQKVTAYFAVEKMEFRLVLSEYHATEKTIRIPLSLDEKTVKEWKIHFQAETNKALGEEIKKFVQERLITDEQL